MVAHAVRAAIAVDLVGMDRQHLDDREVVGHSASFL